MPEYSATFFTCENVWPESMKSVAFYIKSLHFFCNSKAQYWVTSKTLIFILQPFVDEPYNKQKTYSSGSECCFLKYMSRNCNKMLKKSLWQTFFFYYNLLIFQKILFAGSYKLVKHTFFVTDTYFLTNVVYINLKTL